LELLIAGTVNHASDAKDLALWVPINPDIGLQSARDGEVEDVSGGSAEEVEGWGEVG
jgi:hypothetical protein